MKKVTTDLVTKTQDKFADACSMSKGEGELFLDSDLQDDIMSILEWAAERLETQRRNSKLYQKRTQIRSKLIEEHLSQDELAEINRQAEAKVRQQEGR